MPSDVTHDDLLDAIREAIARQEDDTDALTTREICKATGWSNKRVRNHLRELIRDGQVESVRVMRRNVLDDRIQPIPAYRLVESGATD